MAENRLKTAIDEQSREERISELLVHLKATLGSLEQELANLWEGQ